MLEQPAIEHHIQKYIIGILYHRRTARFRDLRPPRTDTNLFSYHLKLLIKAGVIEKRDGGYTLGRAGLLYVDRVSESKMVVRKQPKIVSMLVVQNGEGDILLQRRTKQPYIDCWTLPYGKLHIDDLTIREAAQREALEKLGIKDARPVHAGDCYIRVFDDGEILTSTLAHIFRYDTDTVVPSETLRWVRPHRLQELELAPAVEKIVARTFFKDPYFFEEFDETW
jgi:ADP-ribose pyrophosphatase YjhB (NUDIX family)